MLEEIKLEELSFKELQAEAKARKIVITYLKTKPKLIEAITEYEAPDEKPKENPVEEDPTEETDTEEEESIPDAEGGNGDIVEDDEEDEEEVKLPKEIEKIKGAIDVFDFRGNYITTYAEEVQGENYKELLAEFVGPQPEDAPKDNKGRTIKPHDTTFERADVIDSDGITRASFSRKEYGVVFRQMAISHCSAGLAKLITKRVEGKEIKEEVPNDIIAAQVELRK